MTTQIKMNFIQRIMVQHANPSKFAIDTVAMIVAAYFLWHQNIFWAVILLFGISTLGTLLVWGKKEDDLAHTPLGRWMIGQAHPMNLFVRGIGVIVIAYGLWIHSASYLILGALIVIASRHWILRLTT